MKLAGRAYQGIAMEEQKIQPSIEIGQLSKCSRPNVGERDNKNKKMFIQKTLGNVENALAGCGLALPGLVGAYC